MADIPILGKLHSITVAGIIADAEQIDVNGTKLPTVLDSKETAMIIYDEIPPRGELVSNGYYTLSASGYLGVSLPTGSTANDMIYLSVFAEGTLQIEIFGNYAPTTDIRLSNGDFAEFIATWQPQPVEGKWLLASRVVNSA